MRRIPRHPEVSMAEKMSLLLSATLYNDLQ